MYKPDNQKTVAYLDRELTLEESAAFEENLPEETLEALRKEVVLEGRLAEQLNGPGCPDELWKKLRHRMKPEKSPSRSRVLCFSQKRWLWLPLAASITLVAGLHFARADHSFLERVSTVAALRAEAQLDNPADVLAANGFNLSVNTASQGHHSIKVLGGYTAKVAGEPVAVICINCCGEPIRVLVARRGGRAAKVLLRGRNKENLQTVAWRGDVQLAVIAEHPAGEALSLFEEV